MSIIMDRLTKLYGSHSVVDQISIEIGNGELFVLLGASGSGKSTILRLIAGLVQPDSGRILLHERDVTHESPQQRGTGFVFQNYSIFRHMNVGENVEFGLKIRNVPPADRKRRREQLLDMVGLAGMDERYAHQLSGGQLQRVALARALAYEPSVLLLDEPFGALDSKIRAQLRRSLKEIQQRLQVTTILVTHDQEEAFELADRIGVMDRGRLLETGRPQELYESPRSLFAATFLGAGTVLTGMAVSGFARFGHLKLPIPPETLHEEGARAQILFRPEQVLLSAEKPNSGLPLLGQGKILERTFTGPHQRIRLQLPHLPDTRQVAPATPFGEEGLIVEALIQSNEALEADLVWVGLHSWHILDQPRLRLLVYPGLPETQQACLKFASDLSKKLNAAATLVGLENPQDSSESAAILLQQQKAFHGFSHAEIQVFNGNPTDHLVRMQKEGAFDMIVLGAERTANALLNSILDCCTVPVLIAGPKSGSLKRMLICTAVGEPGKSDVRSGGRLARRIGSEVTLLHVKPNGPGEPSSIALAHMERAVATLRGMDVRSTVRIRPAISPTEGIVQEAIEGNHDLIVVGGHGPRSMFRGEDVTLRVLNRTELPVLVIPIEKEY